MLFHVITCECATSGRGHDAPLSHSFHRSQCQAASAAAGLVLRLPARPWAEAATPHAVARARAPRQRLSRRRQAASAVRRPSGGSLIWLLSASTLYLSWLPCMAPLYLYSLPHMAPLHGYSPAARRHRSRSPAGSAPTSTRPSASCGRPGYSSTPGSSGGSSTRCSTRPLASAAFQPRLTAQADHSST